MVILIIDLTCYDPWSTAKLVYLLFGKHFNNKLCLNTKITENS